MLVPSTYTYIVYEADIYIEVYAIQKYKVENVYHQWCSTYMGILLCMVCKNITNSQTSLRFPHNPVCVFVYELFRTLLSFGFVIITICTFIISYSAENRHMHISIYMSSLCICKWLYLRFVYFVHIMYTFILPSLCMFVIMHITNVVYDPVHRKSMGNKQGPCFLSLYVGASYAGLSGRNTMNDLQFRYPVFYISISALKLHNVNCVRGKFLYNHNMSAEYVWKIKR